MTLLLVRHAHAGSRAAWSGDDRDRPLSAKGGRQASLLVPVLAGFAPVRILSSPSLRCLQTVEPTATAVGLDVEQADELAEGCTVEAVAFVGGLANGTVVACTHGDVAAALLAACRPGFGAGGGAPAALRMGKAEIRLLRRTSGGWTDDGVPAPSGTPPPSAPT